MSEEIITALGTAWGEGGIAIVRVSGEGSSALVDRIFRAKRRFFEQPARYMTLGALHAEDGTVFDEVLAVRFERGNSYTGEESAEIHCHGGALSAQRCIEELCSLGARVALPGEFTRRAFINGRIDLAQAEAVAGIIKARSDEALTASARSLQGAFTENIRALMSRLTELTAALEVDLDFPEEGEGFISEEESAKRIKELSAECAELTSRCRGGMLLRDGIRAAIIGRPNVGKSSLLNALLAENRAIVTATPGTTRDSIEETFIYKGLPIRIIDTAGIRETNDEIEAIGVRRSIKSMEEADIVLRVIDGADTAADEEELPVAKRQIVILNKSDLPPKVTEAEIAARFPDAPRISISAVRGLGLDELKELIVRTALSGGDLAGGYSVTARQMECLARTKEAVDAAGEALGAGAGGDLVLSCLAEARGQLSSLLGLDASEELLDKIFSSFCVGK
ncbi:MAG: tRNA uridine-5-carboxymethylaminomethyl(34) synthesis GTPase MnmE [bacterium]|nr:tRNA uridine-5-carboxymethylaminomethyl(34) synthesis GTPase MnmE [bacterium]